MTLTDHQTQHNDAAVSLLNFGGCVFFFDAWYRYFFPTLFLVLIFNVVVRAAHSASSSLSLRVHVLAHLIYTHGLSTTHSHSLHLHILALTPSTSTHWLSTTLTLSHST